MGHQSIVTTMDKYARLTEDVKFYSKNPIAPVDFKYKVEKKEAESISEAQIEVLLDIIESEKQKAGDA